MTDSFPSLDFEPVSPPPAEAPASAPHVVLIGDAMGDLRRVQQERGPGGLEGRLMPNEQWRLTLLPADGVVRRDPTAEFPSDATHIVISIEGNRAIRNSGLLDSSPESYREALSRLSYAADEFDREVRSLVRAAQASRLPCLICIMFPPRYDEPVHQRAAATALAIFNDRIVLRASEAGVALVDLRAACNEAGDYANESQLSGAGLRKAAELIWRALRAESDAGPGTRIYR